MFICQFDIFGRDRHIYTFENFCSEDKEIALNDGTAKVFLNVTGKMDDINGELKAFLDYVAGKESQDAFVEKLKEAVEKYELDEVQVEEYMDKYWK